MIGSSILFLGLAGVSLWAALMDPAEEVSVRILLAGLGLLFLFGGVYALLWVIRAKVDLFPDRMLIVAPFATDLVSLDELRGWRFFRGAFILHRKEARLRKVKLTVIFPLDDRLTEWLDRLPNLDADDAETSERKILEDHRLGNTVTERAETLGSGSKRAKVLTWISIIASLWALFYPRPYIPLMLLLVVLPWIAAEMMRRSNGLIRADELRNNAHPNVALAWIMPTCMLTLRAVLDYDVLESATVVIWCIAITAAFSAAIFQGDPTLRRKIVNIVLILFTAAYGYGATIEINSLRCRPEQTTYLAVVEHKRIDTSQHTRYQLELGPWGPKTGENDLEVFKDTYTAIQPGDMVVLTVKTGLLGVKSYFLRSRNHVLSPGVAGRN